MTDMRDDDRWRETFQGLRSETERSGSVPAFEAVMAEARARAEQRPALEVVKGEGARSRRSRVRAGTWAAAGLAAALAGIILADRGPSGDEEFERLVAAYASQTGGGGWASPTSGLLEVPGIELTRSVPSIGAPVRGVDPARPTPAAAAPEEETL